MKKHTGNMSGSMSGADMMVKAVNNCSMKKSDVHTMPKKEHFKESKSGAITTGYYPPTMYLDQKDFPGVKDMKAGEDITLAITFRVKNVNSNESENKSESRLSADLEATAIARV